MGRTPSPVQKSCQPVILSCRLSLITIPLVPFPSQSCCQHPQDLCTPDFPAFLAGLPGAQIHLLCGSSLAAFCHDISIGQCTCWTRKSSGIRPECLSVCTVLGGGCWQAGEAVNGRKLAVYGVWSSCSCRGSSLMSHSGRQWLAG